MTDLQKERRLAVRENILDLLASNRVITVRAMEEELDDFISVARGTKEDMLFIHYAAKLPFGVVTRINWAWILGARAALANFLENPSDYSEDYVDGMERFLKKKKEILYGFL